MRLDRGAGLLATCLIMPILAEPFDSACGKCTGEQTANTSCTAFGVSRSPGQEKESRTPEQQKIDSQLLYAIYQARGEAKGKGVPAETITLRKDDQGRVLVDVRAKVTSKLASEIRNLGGKVVSSSEKYNSIIAYVALEKLETIARSQEVKFIMPAAEAITNKKIPFLR